MSEPSMPLLDRQATVRGREVVFTFTDEAEALAALAEARDAADRGRQAVAIVLAMAATMEAQGKAVLIDGEGDGKAVLDLADTVLASEAERARGLLDVAASRSPQFRDGARWAIRRCIAFLHDRAGQMNDPRARDVLNSAAFGMGWWKSLALEDRPDRVERGARR